jgi:hypothetical protein
MTKADIEAIRKSIDIDESLRKQFASVDAALLSINYSREFQDLAKIAKERERMVRAALGPIEELRKAGAFDLSVPKELLQLTNSISSYQAHFRLPEVPEIRELLKSYESTSLNPLLQVKNMWDGELAALERAIGNMRYPWLDVDNIEKSLCGFVELQNIGHGLRTSLPFEDGFTEKLRADLGDWQDAFDFDVNKLVDPVARTDFYLERGLEPSLTAFPANAFVQSTTIAGLRFPEPSVAPLKRESKPHWDDDEEIGFARTNDAHDRLMRFETMIRRFIDSRMRNAFGDKWIKQRVPESIRKRWEEKRQTAQETGEAEWPLIAYADFTDYVAIITRKDNWDGVFSSIFKRQTFVQESFQRLYPIRICTMHARIITQDDELYLFVETKRLLKAIGYE